MRRVSPMVLCLVLVACGCTTQTIPAGRDGSTDAGATDAGAAVDAAVGNDAGASMDGSRIDAAGPADAGCLATACGDTELCYDGIDNDCDGVVEESCACATGSTARCLPGRTTEAVSLCAWGEMRCEAGLEFGMWGECTDVGGGGEGSPYGCRRIGIMGDAGANASSNFQEWLEGQGAIVTRFHATPASASVLRRELLETFDLVIVDWLVRGYATVESETLAEWVRAGGALVVLSGHDSGDTADRHNSLLTALGPTYDLATGPIDGPATLLTHPTTRDAAGTGTLPPVTFLGGLATLVPSELAADVVPIAMVGARTVGVAGPIGEGRVLVFGDEWIEFDSEWSTMPAITQLWLNVVEWAAPESSLGIPVCE